MNHFRINCLNAQSSIIAGDYLLAKEALRFALHHCPNRQAWSKLMLAIRELNKMEQANANS